MTRAVPADRSRRNAAGGESARSLLFTVLGEFALPCAGGAFTSVFLEVLGRLGVEEKAGRQALARTAADGWLVAERIGRRTRWQLSPAAEKLLSEGTERIFSFDSVAEDWDGRWALLLARAPEADRAARHLLRSRLAWSGFGNCSPGVWLSPRSDRLAEVEAVLAEAGVTDAQLFVAEHHGHGSLTELVGQSWNLGVLAERYQRFLAEAGPVELSGADDPLTRTAELVHAWRRFPFSDPELPRQVLPHGWIGARAAAAFRQRHAAWVEPARSSWIELCESA